MFNTARSHHTMCLLAMVKKKKNSSIQLTLVAFILILVDGGDSLGCPTTFSESGTKKKSVVIKLVAALARSLLEAVRREAKP